MTLALRSGTAWGDVWGRCLRAAPEAFHDDRVRNLWAGAWQSGGRVLPATSPVDGSPLAGAPGLGADTARRAVRAALDQHRAWRVVPVAERRARVSAALDALGEHRMLLALLLVWETGMPWRIAQAEVDRGLDGVRWYVGEIDDMIEWRRPLPGPVGNIAGWNHPVSVVVHALLVQALAGNAVIARAPTEGGPACLTLACALIAREDVPVTLVSGGDELAAVLVRAPEVGCVCSLGARDAVGSTACAGADPSRRHVLQQEGLNAWGVWDYSDWSSLAGHLRAAFRHGKQRCTAYPRFVVRRDLLPDFLSAYLPAVRAVRLGHPLAVDDPGDDLPDLDFGPLINAARAKELGDLVGEAVDRGAIALHRGSLDGARLLPGQDTSAYLAPVTLLNPPRASPLHHTQPFGPVDTIVTVDTETELIAAMNASDGALVATLSTDDEAAYARLAPRIRAFKVGHNRPRSRGDRAELFGGLGASWRGAFVGGELLVRAVTRGPADERPPGNFPDYHLMPPEAG
ncbi:aldehyde dehydrogenase family protein [Streptomyces sp. ME03-5709C]|nr:aldehyde dehydrogenase family protein [Streptomyces sp. ME03-5709C]